MIHLGISRKIDWQLVIPSFILCVISLITLFSINPALFISQFAFFFLSCGAFIFFSQVDVRQAEYFTLPIYALSIISLLFLVFLGIESRGAVRWLDIAGFRIQFSEILKPFLGLALASYLSQKNDTSIATFGKVFLLLLPIAILIFKQPDLGTALIYIFTTVLTLLLYGFPAMWFAISAGVIALGIPFFWQLLHQYQRQRLLTFLHFTNDPLGTSYNAIQAIIAVGSGALLGKGLGLGTQSGLRFLPERHTDFIFATLSEDMGFIGGCIVIVAFSFLLLRFFRIFMSTDDLFSKTFIAFAFSLILIQAFLNIGMNIGIVPIVGVTLPFVSYGGSSLLTNAILLGLVSSVGSFSKRKDTLEIR